MSEKLALAIGRYELAKVAHDGGVPVGDLADLRLAVKQAPSTNGVELAWKLNRSAEDGEALDYLVPFALNGRFGEVVSHIGEALGRSNDSWANVAIRDAKNLMAASDD